MSAKIIKNIHCYSVIRMNLFFRAILNIAKDLNTSNCALQIFRTKSSTTRLRFTQNDTTTDEPSAFSSLQAPIRLPFCLKFQLANYLLYLSVQTGISKYKV